LLMAPSGESVSSRAAGAAVISGYAEDAISRHINALNALSQQPPEELGVHAGGKMVGQVPPRPGQGKRCLLAQVDQTPIWHSSPLKQELYHVPPSENTAALSLALNERDQRAHDRQRATAFRMYAARQLGLPHGLLESAQPDHPRTLNRDTAHTTSAPNLQAPDPYRIRQRDALQLEQKSAAALRQDAWLFEFQSLSSAQQQVLPPGGESPVTVVGTPPRSRHLGSAENARLNTGESGGSEVTERAGAKHTHASVPGMSQFPALKGHPDHYRRAFLTTVTAFR